MKKKAIKKVQFWWNPSKVGGGDGRWDADVRYADGTTERRTRITQDDAVALVREAMG